VTLAAGVAPLTQLLPGDLSDTSTQCAVQSGPYKWSMPGLVQALTCVDPNLSGGYIYAFQMNSYAHFVAAWQNFNTWWGFNASAAQASCPPQGTGSTAEGITKWNDPYFPQQTGQSLECEWVGTNSDEPAFAYSYPTEDTFMTAQGAANSTFSALNTWWMDSAAPAVSPSPSAP